MTCCNAALCPSGVYDASAGWSMVTISCTAAAASSLAMPANPDPGTTMTIGCPPASCCAAATASQVARFSLPPVCSAMTRIMIEASLLDHPRFFPKPSHQLLRRLGRGSADDLGFLGFLGNVQLD